MNDRAINQFQDRINRDRDALRARRDRLVQQVRSAFQDVELGDGVTIAQAFVIDDFGSPKNQMSARETDRHVHWTQVDLWEIDPNAMALSFLDEDGLRFYLGGYLIFVLEHCHEQFEGKYTDSNFASSVRSTLANTSTRMCLDAQQRRCVARFLALDLELDWCTTLIGWIERSSTGCALRDVWNEDLEHTERKRLSALFPKHFSA